MAKVVECRHAGLPCGAKVRGDTEEEVLENLVGHARKKHGVDLTQAKTLVRYAQTLVRDESEAKR